MIDEDAVYLTDEQLTMQDIFKRIKAAETLDEARRLADEGLQAITDFAI